MSDIQLGLLIDGPATRDAIHVAIAPVYSDEKLMPGQHVSLVEGTNDKVCTSDKNKVGIVDPFLRRSVEPGQRFWLCLYLRTVTSLKHSWSHPAFKDEESKPDTKASEQWLRNYCSDHGLPYERLMETIASGEMEYHVGDNEQDPPPDEFWDHYEAMTGCKKHPGRERFYFSCAC